MSNGHDDDDKTPPPGAPDLPRVAQRPSAPPVAPAQGGFRPIVTAPGGRKPTAPGMPLVPPTAGTPAPATRLPTISPTTAIVPPSQNPAAGGRAAPTIAPAPLAPVIAPAVAPGTPRPAPAPQRPAAPVIAPAVMAPIAPPTPVIAPPVMAPIAPARPAGPVIAPPVMSPVPARPVIAPPVMSPAPARTASSGGVLIPPAAPGVPNTRPPTQPPGAIVPPPPALIPPAPVAARPPSSSGSGMRRASPIPESGAVESISPAQAQELRRMASQINALDYFQVLGLTQAASGGEIKKAFYRESRTYHPDRFFHIADAAVKDDLGTLYKRITEAYYVLKDDQKRKKYVTDITSADRLNKLRYTEASEVEVKAEARKVVEEEFGTNPKSRPFFKSGLADFDKGNWEAAIRNLKMGLMYEPGNARFKEKLAEAQKKEEEERRKRGPNYMIK